MQYNHCTWGRDISSTADPLAKEGGKVRKQSQLGNSCEFQAVWESEGFRGEPRRELNSSAGPNLGWPAMVRIPLPFRWPQSFVIPNSDLCALPWRVKQPCLKMGLPRWRQCERIPLPVQETQETCVWSLDRDDPLEEEMATHSSILAWKIPWTEKPGRLQSMGSQRVRRDWACIHAHKYRYKYSLR